MNPYISRLSIYPFKSLDRIDVKEVTIPILETVKSYAIAEIPRKS
jgi:hypothetical protein